MAFSTARTEYAVWGNKRVFMCDFSNNGGSTGGAILTGLSTIERVMITGKGAAVHANAPVYNETLPKNGGSLTIVTDANVAGNVIAVGL